jgi:arylsulfatase
MLFSADETVDLGKDHGSAVSDDYTPENSDFTGTVNWVQLEIGDDSHDHLITPEDRLRAAMVRQ